MVFGVFAFFFFTFFIILQSQKPNTYYEWKQLIESVPENRLLLQGRACGPKNERQYVCGFDVEMCQNEWNNNLKYQHVCAVKCGFNWKHIRRNGKARQNNIGSTATATP